MFSFEKKHNSHKPSGHPSYIINWNDGSELKSTAYFLTKVENIQVFDFWNCETIKSIPTMLV